MKITDLNNLLEKADSLAEELSSQTAAGPELKPAKELDNEATEEKKEEPKAEEVKNDDVFPECEHTEGEEVEPAAIKEEAENEATEERKPEEVKPELENKDLLPADEHKEEKDVEPAEELKESLSDADLFQALDESGYEPTYENLAILKEGLADGTFAIAEGKIVEDIPVDGDEPQVEDAKEAEEKADEEAKEEHPEEEKDEEKEEASEEDKEEHPEEEKDEEKEEASEEDKEEKEEEKKEEDKEEASEEKEEKEEASEEDKKEDEPEEEKEDEAEPAEHAKELEAITDAEPSDLELMHALKENGYEPTIENLQSLKEAISTGAIKLEEIKEEAPTDLELMHALQENGYEATIENLQSLKEAISTGAIRLVEEESQTAAGPELKPAKELDNEATEEKKEEPKAEEVKNDDVFPECEHSEGEELEPAEIKESEQVAAGPELKPAKELDNEATEEKKPEAAPADMENKDVFCDDCHDQKKDLEIKEAVELVIEAARRCKACKKPATKANICEEAAKLSGKDFAEKEYDTDADIASDEMNGHGEPSYEELIKKNGTIAYKSIKEACMLDENYFKTDTYTVDTAASKCAKLTEQVSLLMAREAMDPMYDELVKTAMYAQRLQEALVSKYGAGAEEKVSYITESK